MLNKKKNVNTQRTTSKHVIFITIFCIGQGIYFKSVIQTHFFLMNSTRGHEKITKVVKRGVVSRKTAKLKDCQRVDQSWPYDSSSWDNLSCIKNQQNNFSARVHFQTFHCKHRDSPKKHNIAILSENRV